MKTMRSDYSNYFLSFLSVLFCCGLLMLTVVKPAYSSNQDQSNQDNSSNDQKHEHHHNHMDMEGHAHHGMTMDSNGMVMNENTNNIPLGCDGLVESQNFHVIANSQAAEKIPGTTFSFFPREFKVKPCTKLTVTFENKDSVRHQWMVHGLPRFMYDGGMFHLEAYGGKTVVGTFIVPLDDKTYLVHCDISQHMQKGMKGMLTVGKGSGVISGIPGKSGYFFTGGKGFVSELGIVISFGIITLLLICIQLYRRN